MWWQTYILKWKKMEEQLRLQMINFCYASSTVLLFAYFFAWESTFLSGQTDVCIIVIKNDISILLSASAIPVQSNILHESLHYHEWITPLSWMQSLLHIFFQNISCRKWVSFHFSSSSYTNSRQVAVRFSCRWSFDWWTDDDCNRWLICILIRPSFYPSDTVLSH